MVRHESARQKIAMIARLDEAALVMQHGRAERLRNAAAAGPQDEKQEQRRLTEEYVQAKAHWEPAVVFKGWWSGATEDMIESAYLSAAQWSDVDESARLATDAIRDRWMTTEPNFNDGVAAADRSSR